MEQQLRKTDVISWVLGAIVFNIGLANLLLVHPVPGFVFLLLSFLFLPPVNDYLRKTVGFSIPFLVRILLALIILCFTLGISDLGDMIDKW